MNNIFLRLKNVSSNFPVLFCRKTFATSFYFLISFRDNFNQIPVNEFSNGKVMDLWMSIKVKENV